MYLYYLSELIDLGPNRPPELSRVSLLYQPINRELMSGKEENRGARADFPHGPASSCRAAAA